MKIYIDNDYKCHASNNGQYREVETDFFDNRCTAFIEGYRYVPAGEIWTREDGVRFHGEMASPWRDYSRLEELQGQADALNAEHNVELAGMVEDLYSMSLALLGEEDTESEE